MKAFLFTAAAAGQTSSLNPLTQFKPQKYHTEKGDQHDRRRHTALANVSQPDRKVDPLRPRFYFYLANRV